MEAKIRTWGNSLALRIPRDYAQNLQLEEGSTVDLQMVGNELVIRPKRQRPSLSYLLEGVTPELIGGEVNWGPAQGAEEW